MATGNIEGQWSTGFAKIRFPQGETVFSMPSTSYMLHVLLSDNKQVMYQIGHTNVTVIGGEEMSNFTISVSNNGNTLTVNNGANYNRYGFLFTI